MPDEEKSADAPAAKPSLVGKLLPFVVVMVLGAAGGGFLFKMWAEPRLNGDAIRAKSEAHGEDKIPETATFVPFDDFMLTVLQPDKTKPASLLMVSMSLLCSNEEAAHLVDRDKDYFRGMINKLHSYKTREELDDPLLKDRIEKEVLRLANERLEKLLRESNEEVKILEAIHTKFTIVDQ